MEVLLISVDISAFQHGLVQKGTLKCLNSVRALNMRQDKPYLLAMKEKKICKSGLFMLLTALDRHSSYLEKTRTVDETTELNTIIFMPGPEGICLLFCIFYADFSGFKRSKMC